MKLFGLSITRASETKALAPVFENRGGWLPVIRESFSGAWQRNITLSQTQIIAYWPVYACLKLISQDVSKLRVKLVEQQDGIWSEIQNPAYSPVLRRPNPYQNRIQFFESWMLSKLTRGNTYALKQRDERGVVNRLYILDPVRTKPLVADDGSVFYEIDADNLTGIESRVVVPAREIIHDRMNCLFHPLVGVAPLYAAALAATQGVRIQNNSAWFFGNRSMPGGILTAPNEIGQETASRLKADWDANYTGEGAGKVAVLGDGLKFESISTTAKDAEMLEQLKWTAEVVCSVFNVPPYKIGLGTMPTYNNIQSLNVEYYSQCLQSLIESAELCLDEGLEIRQPMGTEFDLDGLLRMDTLTQVSAIRDSIGAGFMTPNEGRKKMDMRPVPGGDTPYLQQQYYSLEALSKRDAQADPFASNAPAVTPPEEDDEEIERALSENAIFGGACLRKQLIELGPPAR